MRPDNTAEMLRVVAQWAATIYLFPPSKVCIYFHGLSEPVVLPMVPVQMMPIQPQPPKEK
jgi:hypothetical protein